MFTYSALCGVPVETLDFLAGLLHAHRRAHDARPYQRAGTARTQANLVLRWCRDGSPVANRACDHHLSQATAYRYFTGGIKVIAAEAPQLHEILDQARHDGVSGTLIPTDRVVERTEKDNHAWY